jgi:hypothetical protein
LGGLPGFRGDLRRAAARRARAAISAAAAIALRMPAMCVAK